MAILILHILWHSDCFNFQGYIEQLWKQQASFVVGQNIFVLCCLFGISLGNYLFCILKHAVLRVYQNESHTILVGVYVSNIFYPISVSVIVADRRAGKGGTWDTSQASESSTWLVLMLQERNTGITYRKSQGKLKLPLATFAIM